MNKFVSKISSLLVSIIIFAIIYSLLDNSHFEGINPIQDKLKEQEIEEKTEEIIQETENEIENDSNKILESFYDIIDNKADEPEEEIKENVEKVAEEDKKKLKKGSLYQNFFDKLYFSVITACLVGYGDIYPSTNLVKTIVSVQTLTTLGLILY